MYIVNTFAFLGIYDYTAYLFVDFYKGDGIIYARFWEDKEDIEINNTGGTIDIIYNIFKITILSNRKKRRRDR